jgi:hypothetical protein
MPITASTEASASRHADRREVVDAQQVLCRDAQQLQSLPAAKGVDVVHVPRHGAVEVGEDVERGRLGQAELGEGPAG